MPPVTYVLAMFVTYVLASDPPERPKACREGIGSESRQRAARPPDAPSRGPYAARSLTSELDLGGLMIAFRS